MNFFSLFLTSVILLPTLLFSSTNNTLLLQQKTEPNEKAFTLLVPQGWQTDGGIFRLDPNQIGGAGNAIAAKVDFTVKNNQGTVIIRWLPDMLYFDMRYSPAGQMGLFPNGSNYNGMSVYPVMTAEQFIQNQVIPYAHPGLSNYNITEQKPLPDLEQAFLKHVQTYKPQLTMSYNACLATLTYTENGTQYREKIITIIENWGQLGAGLWGNKETLLIRAPEDEFNQWQPLLSLIQNSVQLNAKWLKGEIRGQSQRSATMIEVLRETQKIEQAIVDHRQKMNAEIHNDMFLTLTDQEEYVNPFTNNVETGSNQWHYRWTNPNGDVIYTDNESYDPRTDVNLNRTDYKRTPVRKRFGE